MKIITHKLNKNSDITAYILDSYAVTFKEPMRPAAIICPGGGFFSLSEREGEPIALAFYNEGIPAFVLHYSIGETEKAEPEYLVGVMEEYAMAMDWIVEHSEEWNIDKNKLIGVGFSAGAYVTAMYGNGWKKSLNLKANDRFQNKERLSAVVLGYPMCDMEAVLFEMEQDEFDSDSREILLRANQVLFGEKYPNCWKVENKNPINWINNTTPRTFLWHTTDDEILSVRSTYHYAERLSQKRIPHEVHIYESGVHGMALGRTYTAAREQEINSNCEGWFAEMIKWLKINY